MNATASALINGALLSLPLTAAVWLALRLTPRHVLNASTRYVIWWVALAACLALPAFFPESRALPAARVSSVGQPSIAALQPQPGPVATSGFVRLPVTVSVEPRMHWFPAAWLFASTILVWRLLLSHLALFRACARASDPPPDWRHRLALWHIEAGRRRGSVRIAASSEITVPFAAGLLHPTIIIPAGLFDLLPGDDLDRVGLHEAAHLARFDDCAILVERLLVAILPWHLAAWWIVRQIDMEREIACDDRVVAATGSPRRYADCLTRVVELCGGLRNSLATAGLSGHWAHLSRRVVLLVATPRHARPRVRPASVLPFALGLLALVLMSARVPRLVAFTRPAVLTSIVTAPQEKPMTSQTAKKLGRKLAIAAATAAIAAPVASAQAAAPQPQAQVQAASGRYIAFLVDTVEVPAGDLQRAADMAARFVDGQMRAGDKLALLVATGQGVRVRQDFTGDRDQFMKAVRVVTAPPDNSAGSSPNAADHRANFVAAVRMLEAIRERKTLVYLSTGTPAPTPEQAQQLLSDAQRANLTVYAVDIGK